MTQCAKPGGLSRSDCTAPCPWRGLGAAQRYRPDPSRGSSQRAGSRAPPRGSFPECSLSVQGPACPLPLPRPDTGAREQVQYIASALGCALLMALLFPPLILAGLIRGLHVLFALATFFS